MFVSRGGRVFQDDLLLSQIMDLAQNNYAHLRHYFQPSSQPFIEPIGSSLSSISVPKQSLYQLYNYLESSANILANKFVSILQYGQKSDYDYLRTVWQKHHQRSNDQSLQNKFDSLNQTISMLKLKIRQSTHHQAQQNRKIWEEEYSIQAKEGIWSHPLFQVMNRKISNLGMKCSELEMKLEDSRQQNVTLNKKNEEIESKVGAYKQKIKRIQKQMFQLSKKKAQIEKQILQKDFNKVTKVQDQRLSAPSNQDKQNSSAIKMRHSEYIFLLEQEHKEPRASLEPSIMSSANIRDKYRHVKNLSRRTTTMLSPNVSLDSIKSVKFERTGGKKLIIKGS